MSEVKVILGDFNKYGYERYIVVDKASGMLLDDAQGYGYKSAQKAHAAWGWKTRDKSKDKEKELKRQHIKQWMKEHRGFVRQLEGFAFEMAKGSWGPDDKVDAKFVRKMFKQYDLHPDFTAGEFLRVWRSRS